MRANKPRFLEQILFSSLVLLFTQAPALQAQNGKPIESQIKIGVVAPLTGNAAHIGNEITRDVEIIRQLFCGEHCRFIIEDGKAATDPSPVAAMQKLISLDHVNLFIVASSGEVLQMAPVAEREHALLMGVYSGHADIKHFGDAVFRTFPDFEEGAKTLAQVLKKEQALPLAVLTEDHSFTRGMSDLLIHNLPADQVSEENYPYDTQDFSSLLLKANRRSPRAFYLSCANPRTCANIVLQAKRLGIKQRLYSFLHLDNDEFLKTAGSAAEGVRFLGTPLGSNDSERFQRFLEAYQKSFPDAPRNDFLMRSTFDAATALLECGERGKQAQSKVADCLYHYRAQGALGQISFDKNGDVEGVRYIMKEIRNGRVIQVPSEASRQP